jgi:mRNA interferase MazF
MTCSPGDLILIPFPFSDLKATKKRPVLALTSPDRHGDFIGLAVTSVPQPPPNRLIDTTHLSMGNLPKVSWVRVDKVFTLDHRLMINALGRVNTSTLEQILAALCDQIGYGGT